MFKKLLDLIRRLFTSNTEKQIEAVATERKTERRIVCPRCLESIVYTSTKQTCTNCLFDIPPRYIQNFDSSPPIFIQVFGWSQHGKTMFLDVLRLQLIENDRIYKLWNGYFHASLTDLDIEHESTLRIDRQKALLPGSTQKKDRDQNEVYITQMANMERWGSRMMVIMDHAGEDFERMDGVPTQEIPYLINTPTTFMLISVPDILKNLSAEGGARNTSMDQLLQVYLDTMIRNDVDLQTARRNMVVVLTKADMMLDRLPPNLRHYLTNDEIYRAFQQQGNSDILQGEKLSAYLERMRRVSDEIRDWIQSDPRAVPGGNAFIRQVEYNGINARYAMISATGGDVKSGGGVQLMPRRILDPFFWALEFQSQ